jgi:hypothetical protein
MKQVHKKIEYLPFLKEMKKFLFTISILLVSLVSFAQDPGYLDLLKAERELNGLFIRLYSDKVAERDSLLSVVDARMREVLTRDGAMEYPWNGLEKIGVVTSDDRQVRIFTWHVMDDPDHYRYFGFIQVAARKGTPKIYELRDNMKPQRNTQKAEQSVDNWYGKLYYGMVTVEHRNQTFYTLLGLDFNDRKSSIKTLETMVLHRSIPRFEGGHFFNGRDYADRVVLEYSSQVSMIARYDPILDLIAFDHLAPFHPIYEGNFEFYGPDGSFDGYKFEEGSWILREDLDARNID